MNFLQSRVALMPSWLKQTLVDVLLFVCYQLSFPANRSESDDGYMYASIVAQENSAATDLYDLKFVLFLPIAKGIFTLVQQVHPKADAYLLMCRLSVVCAALTLLIFYHLLR